MRTTGTKKSAKRATYFAIASSASGDSSDAWAADGAASDHAAASRPTTTVREARCAHVAASRARGFDFIEPPADSTRARACPAGVRRERGEAAVPTTTSKRPSLTPPWANLRLSGVPPSFRGSPPQPPVASRPEGRSRAMADRGTVDRERLTARCHPRSSGSGRPPRTPGICRRNHRPGRVRDAPDVVAELPFEPAKHTTAST